jgi:hypothetical protein
MTIDPKEIESIYSSCMQELLAHKDKQEFIQWMEYVLSTFKEENREEVRKFILKYSQHIKD